MKILLSLSLLLASLSTALQSAELAQDWPWWRGPHSNGVAAAGQTPPVQWSATDNVIWKVAIPGRGHSSPIVVGQRVLLTTADEAAQTQSVICIARKTGEQQWQTEVNQGGFAAEIHNKNTYASPSLTCDGKRLFAVFCNHGHAQLVALNMAGEVLWKKDAASYAPRKFKYGYAPSPLLYKGTVIVAAEYDGEGSSIAAFACDDGRQVWRTPRPRIDSYSSPIIANVEGSDQMLLSGCGQTTSYNPSSGELLWKVAGPSRSTCGTMVWDNNLVFASGGFRGKETLAIRADGSGEVVWRNTDKCYEQSLLAHDGLLFSVNDTGIANCWNAQTGQLHWKKRLSGPVSVSPTFAGGNVYAADEKGNFYVFRAAADKFTLVARNKLGDESFASPTIVDSQIFLRVADRSSGKRQETLYCIGTQKTN